MSENGKNEKLFLPEVHERHEDPLIKKARHVMEGYSKLQTFITVGANPYGEEPLKFYSELYREMEPQLTELTFYLILNGSIHKSKKIEKTVHLAQQIMGRLRILHERYFNTFISGNPIYYTDDIAYARKSNEDLILDIAFYFSELDQLRQKKWEVSFSHFFFFYTHNISRHFIWVSSLKIWHIKKYYIIRYKILLSNRIIYFKIKIFSKKPLFINKIRLPINR